MNPAAQLIQADIRDRTALELALEDVDSVIHCAAAVGVAQSLYRVEHYVDVNVRGSALLLDLLIGRSPVLNKLILLTSMTGYGEGVYRRPSDHKFLRVGVRSSGQIRQTGWEPVCPETGEVLEPVPTPEDAVLLATNVYALTKRYQEELALSLGQIYGLPVVCLRLYNVYGPRQSLSNPYTGVLAIFLSRLIAGQPPVVYEDGLQTRDFVSVYDVVRAVMLSLHSKAADGQVINIGTGIPRPIGECARTLARLLGREDLEPQITARFRQGDIRHCLADIRKARALLGFEPQVSWDDGLAELLEWSRNAQTARDRFTEAERELCDRGLVH